MRLSRTYSSSEMGGSAPAEQEPETELFPEDEYSHLNRNTDSPIVYFLKFLVVISAFWFIYLFLTGKL